MKDPNLRAALDVASAEIATAVREGSAALTRLGIRHALCGGIAVSAYARPRTTKDVDFVVGEEAYDRAGALVSLKAGVPMRIGSVAVDTVPLVPSLLSLDDMLAHAPRSDGIPVIQPEALVAMKLVAGRAQDRADVVALVSAGAVNPEACREFLRARGFETHLKVFDACVEEAE